VHEHRVEVVGLQALQAALDRRLVVRLGAAQLEVADTFLVADGRQNFEAM